MSLHERAPISILALCDDDTSGRMDGRMSKLAVVETAEEKRESRVERQLPYGRVTVFPNWCKGCDLCVELCPVNMLQLGPGGRVVVAHPDRCTACRVCELHCPDFAIVVTDIGPQETE